VLRSHVDSLRVGLGFIPGHEVVDAVSGPAIDELAEGVGEPGVRIDAIQLRCLDQRSDDRPISSTLIAAGKERIFTIEGNRPD
jgi:hypothetical protein